MSSGLVGFLAKSSDPDVASVRFRCLKPIEGLRRLGQPAELFSPARAKDYRVVVFSKQYGREAQELARTLRNDGVRTILDLCDNHFYNPHRLDAYDRAADDQRTMVSLVDAVVCSTTSLAAVVRDEAGLSELPAVVGDPIELEAAPARRPRRKGRPRLLWYGIHGSPNAPSGMDGLSALASRLEDLFKTDPFELVVMSNSRKRYEALVAHRRFPSRYADWTRTSFVRALSTATAAVLPVTENPFTRCKSNNRLATALFAGVPVVADAIPSYAGFSAGCWLDDWEGGLRAVLSASPEVSRRTTWGQAYAARTCGLEAIARQWQEALAPLLAERCPGRPHSAARPSDYAGSGGGTACRTQAEARPSSNG